MSKKFNVAIYIILILSILITIAVIFGNSIKGPEESKGESDAVVEVVKPIIDPNDKMSNDDVSFLVRKSGHFIEYLILGIECALLAYHINKRISYPGAVSSAFGCLLAANADEFIQSFTDRGSLVSDVLIDLCGSVVGIAVGFSAAYAVARIIKKKKAE